jgi:hemoglobin-like flavoprotein
VDARTIALIQHSFDKLCVAENDPAAVFYTELFAIAPSLRVMFSGDMDAQQRKFLSALGYIVAALDAPDKILGGIQKLAQVHRGYGVRPEHYTPFGNALLRTLKRTLQSEFTPELCDAWSDAYRALVEIMNEAAYAGNAAAARDRATGDRPKEPAKDPYVAPRNDGFAAGLLAGADRTAAKNH